MATDRPSNLPMEGEVLREEDLLDPTEKLWVGQGDPKSMTPDGAVVKTIITPGTGWEKPFPPCEVAVRIQGKVSGEILFEEQCRRYMLGEEQLCRGMEIAIRDMRKGEVAKVSVKGHYLRGQAELLGTSVEEEPGVEFEVELLSWIVINDVFKEGGIMIKPIQTSLPTDKPTDLDMVYLRYRGREAKSDSFFESEGFGEGEGPVRVQVKRIRPRGLQVAVREMWKGCTFWVTLSHEYAFGPHGDSKRKVKGEAKVEYEVEIVDVRPIVDLTNDEGVLVEYLSKPGLEVRKPTEGCVCSATYSTAVEGDGPRAAREFESFTSREIEIGKFDLDITDGLERALQHMVKGQSALVHVTPAYAYGEEGRGGDVPPNKAIEYRVTLLDWKAAETKSMTAEEKVMFANKIKDAGNSFFNIGKFQRSYQRYSAAYQILEVPDSSESPETRQEGEAIKISCLLNMAACEIKRNNWKEAIAKCNAVLKVKSSHPKALFRRASAYIEVERFVEAEQDLEALKSMGNEDKAVQVWRGRGERKALSGNRPCQRSSRA
uniref:peptidylprolyl isomerase n=1 Tax=Guillardia theta TaxID=55529 RepID=A0A6U5ZHH7_GUITH|mmetsp:Transcript_2577/g.8523  ORF Transcript_2577/g.8523 Transcript_2577/m.8523 type:complete len:545 (+) Transcript_2577:72-1706(+)